jgi:hypothetical protein
MIRPIPLWGGRGCHLLNTPAQLKHDVRPCSLGYRLPIELILQPPLEPLSIGFLIFGRGWVQENRGKSSQLPVNGRGSPGVFAYWHLLHPAEAMLPRPAEAERSGARLLPSRPSERFIDPVLPAGPGFLEVVKHIPIDAQRNQLFDVRERRLLGRKFHGLCCCRLESRFGGLPRVHWPSNSVACHLSPCLPKRKRSIPDTLGPIMAGRTR